MTIQLTIDFPMRILGGYRGGLGNLDETLDDNISYLVGRYFYRNGLGFSIISMDIVEAVPNRNDELVRYSIQVEQDDAENCAGKIVDELAGEGYEKGCTIRGSDGRIIHFDLETADIQIRRQARGYAP